MAAGVLVFVGPTVCPILAQPPNFVVLFPDQLRAHEVGCYGEVAISSPVSTPNLDTLAASGVRFHNALSSFPLCTPARASLLTGRMPFAVRSTTAGEEWMIRNGNTLAPDEITVAEQLRDLGYACGYVGKWHLTDIGTLQCVPPEQRQGFDWFEGYNAYGGQTDAKYYDSDCVLHSSPSWLPEVNTDSAVRFITGHQNDPFFVMISYGPPHAVAGYNWSQIAPPDAVFTADRLYLWDQFKTASVTLRPNVTSFDPDPVYQHRMYHAMVAGIDDQLRRIRESLAALGLTDNTIIIVSSDHGSDHGSHGDWDKNDIWEEAMRVPLIVYDPRQAPAVSVHTAPVSLIDVMPTVVELAGGTPTRAQGRSFAPLVTGSGTYVPREAALIQLRQAQIDGTRYYRPRVLRTERWKLAVGEVGDGTCNLQPKALFDLQADPYELNNLIANPAFSAIRDQLWALMVQEMQAAADPLLCAVMPWIAVNPSSMHRTALIQTDLPDDAFTVANTGISLLNYTITDDAEWLSVSPQAGSSSGEVDTIQIRYATSHLAPGDYTATITVHGEGATPPQTVRVTLHVGPAASMARVAVDLGGHTEADSGQDNEFGLWRPVPEPPDGDTIVLLREDRHCRRVAEPSSGDHYIYFRVDDQFAHEGSRPNLFITMDYQDKGTGSIQLQYDGAGGAYTDGGTISLNATDAWLQHTFHVTDAFFGGRQDGQADFRIHRPVGFLLLDLVQIGETPPPPPEIRLDPPAIKHVVPVGGTLPDDSFTLRNAGGGKLVYVVSADAGWLEAAPADGTSIGEPDMVQVMYHLASQVPGRYTGAVTVSDPGASNPAQSWTVELNVMTPLGLQADFDDDGDVDRDDLEVLVGCASGATVPQTRPECDDPDLDNDEDVDLIDFAILQRCLGGADRAPGC